jgi:hypothetical protein
VKHAVLVSVLAASIGCGTIFNKNPAKVTLASGVSVDGDTGDTELDQKEDHVVTLPDGRTCKLESGISVGYFLVDLFFTGPIGIVVDAVTGGWKIMKGDCPEGIFEH